LSVNDHFQLKAENCQFINKLFIDFLTKAVYSVSEYPCVSRHYTFFS